ncbi:hypothetical protein JCM15765_24560 [Paradesulfitobacterium aromaticivorans]
MSRIHKFVSFIVALLLLFTFNPIYTFASNQTVRLAGNSRYDTAIAISQQGWKSSEFAIIASGERFQDALIAAPLSKLYNCPILLTSGGELDDKLKNELARLNVKKAYLIGTLANVSSVFEYQMYLQGIETIRLAGKDDYATSAAVAAQKFGATDTVVLVNGDSYADALSIAPIAAAKGWPILFTAKDYLPSDVSEYLASSDAKKTYIIGGTGVISDSVASQTSNPERIWGFDRYDTNMQVISHFSSEIQTQKVYLATGENYPDALAGTALAQMTNSPIVLINPYGMSDTTKQYLSNLPGSSVLNILGGTSVVPDNVLQQPTSSTSPTYMSDKFKPYYTKHDYKVNPVPQLIMGQTTYDKGYQFWSYDAGGETAASFNLDGTVTTISGLIGLDDKYPNIAQSTDTITVLIKGDGKTLRKYDLPPGCLPQNINLNVAGVKKLDFVFSRPDNWNPLGIYVDFANLVLDNSGSAPNVSPTPTPISEKQFMSDKFAPYYDTVDCKVNPLPLMKMGTESYEKGYQLTSYDAGSKTGVSFNLNGVETNISGLIGLDDKYPNIAQSTDTITVIFKGDGTTLGKYDLPPGSLPQNLNLNVTGVKKLDVVISRPDNWNPLGVYIDLANLMIN